MGDKEIKPLLIVSGSYGSGKTEYAVNLARRLAQGGEAVVLVDLDVVNPYFRSRDVREAFAEEGIEVVAPEGEFSHADLPMLSPRVGGAISRLDRTVILDAGGDPMGARVLGRYRNAIKERGYELRLVLNGKRPDTRTPDEARAMMDAIESRSGLGFTEVVANTHLMEETDAETVRQGVALAREVAGSRNIRFNTVLVLERLLPEVDGADLDAEVFVLTKFMKKPWEVSSIPHRRI